MQECGLRTADCGLRIRMVTVDWTREYGLGTVSIFYVLRAKKWCVTGG